MVDATLGHIEVKMVRLGEFQRELRQLLQEAADGKYETELRARGITLPAEMSADAITFESISGQPVAPSEWVELAIAYAPLGSAIGLALWSWAWPKLKDRFDGAARDHKPGH